MECLIVIGDFDRKVGQDRENDMVDSYGLGKGNENGQMGVVHNTEKDEESN